MKYGAFPAREQENEDVSKHAQPARDLVLCLWSKTMHVIERSFSWITASELMLQSLDMTVQIKSLVVLQCVYKGRGALESWNKSADVQNLDEQIHETLTILNKMKEQV